MATVIIKEEERINLAGLILKEILVKNLEDENKNKIADRLTGSILVMVEGMKVIVQFQAGEIIIKPADKEKTNARVYAKLNAVLEIATGGSKKIILSFIRGEFKIGGNIFLLLKFAKLLKV